MNTTTAIAAGVGAIALATGGVVAADQLGAPTPLSATATTTATVAIAATETRDCNDWNVQLTSGECFAAGTIRYVSLYNLQGAAQFCKWKAANPGEWSRLKTYSETEGAPLNIVTWLGGHIKNDIEAYFATGAPAFIIKPNTAPNICGGKIIAPPTVAGTTAGQTDATVTLATTP